LLRDARVEGALMCLAGEKWKRNFGSGGGDGDPDDR